MPNIESRLQEVFREVVGDGEKKDVLDNLVLSTVLLLRPHTHHLSRTRIVRVLCPDFNEEDEKAVSASLQRLKKVRMVYHLDYGISGWFPTPKAESGPPMVFP
jgi:hypothetical protein